nr:immunoglobulin light chain junction region [Macaca mulatta]MOX32868.1 immunoglobulin light chain junction region [Macaca mulatta]
DYYCSAWDSFLSSHIF